MVRLLIIFILYPLLILATVILLDTASTLKIYSVATKQTFYTALFEGIFLISLMIINENILRTKTLKISYIALVVIAFFVEMYVVFLAPLDFNVNIRGNIYDGVISGVIVVHIIGLVMFYFIGRSLVSK